MTQATPWGTDPIDTPRFVAIQADQLRYYVYGRVRYKDIFGSEHLTKMCFYYVRGTEKTFYSCPEYNYED